MDTISKLLKIIQESENGEIPENIKKQLSISRIEINDKIQNYQNAIKKMKESIDILDLKSKELLKDKKTFQKNIEILKKSIGNAVQVFGQKNNSGNTFYKCDNFKVTVSNSSILKIMDKKIIPNQYKKEIKTIKIDNASIKKDLLNGEVVDGAIIDTSKINVIFN